MERHVNLLGILATLWGALAMVAGVSLLLLAAAAFAQVVDPVGNSLTIAAGLTAAAFALLGAFAMLWGGLHVIAGKWVRAHRPAGRVLMLGLAITNLLVLPFGTALGAYALWALLANDGRRLFENHSGSGVPAAP